MISDVPPSTTDEELVARIKTGDKQANIAQHELYLRHAQNLLGFLINQGVRFHQAEDLTHDVWMKVFQRIDQFRDGEFTAWLYEIARNTFRDMRRKKQPSLLAEMPETNSAEPDELEVTRLAALRSCLEQLQGEMIEVLRARLAGDSTREIAQRFNIEERTVYTRVSRAKEDLSKCIGSKVS